MALYYTRRNVHCRNITSHEESVKRRLNNTIPQTVDATVAGDEGQLLFNDCQNGHVIRICMRVADTDKTAANVDDSGRDLRRHELSDVDHHQFQVHKSRCFFMSREYRDSAI